MKKFIEIGSWSLLIVALVAILGFVSSIQSKKVCSEILINIDETDGNYFIEKTDIYSMMYHEIDSIVGRPLDDIKTEKLEFKINNHPSVLNAEIHKTVSGDLVIEVKQRTPIVRIFTADGDSYYLDKTGKIMPPSTKYTSRVFVANGHIFESFIAIHITNINSMTIESKKESMIDDIFAFAEFIQKDELWKAQIEQLYVNKDLEIELIPRVGSHRIVFGDASDIEKKFNKLKVFYKKGLNNTGWNEYSVINLKYANQVVCTKRI